MYSWGDDTSTWKNPGAYDYGSARKPYLEDLAKDAADKGPRSYALKSSPNLALVDPKGKTIKTESEDVIVVAVDGTGSMQTWPAEIFDRLPLLYQTLSKYRPNTEISFSVIGDATSDTWPSQISDFGKGVALDDYLKALKPEGGGGGGMRESYELWGYFMNQYCEMPKAISPTLIIMGDEKFYPTINPAQVEHYLGRKLQSPLDSVGMWKELGNKFDIYLLRKSYAGHDEEIIKQWAEAIGPQRIIPVEESTRAVDVALGLVAKKWGYFSDFKTNLSARQDEDNIKKVMKSLKAASVAVPGSVKSTLVGASTASKKSKKLTEE